MLVAYEKIYKMMYQVLEQDYNEGINWYKNWPNIKIVNDFLNIDKSIPIILPSDIQRSIVRQSLNNNQPAIYIGRGYVGNHMYKTRQLWRYSVNGWANTKLLDVPYSRWDVMNLEKHPWKVKEVKNVLIAPSKMTQPIWDSSIGWNWAEYMSTKFPGANVKIRIKPKKSGLRWATLFEDLDWADLVVAQGSAITAEAFWYGKKAISTHPCITWAAQKNTLDDWQDPTEPNLRDDWHEHLAWSQFRNEEWESGAALELIEKYFKSIINHNSNHHYYFK